MGKEKARPEKTKAQLIQESRRHFAIPYFPEFGHDLLFGGSTSFRRWLKSPQVEFVELEPDAVLTSEIEIAGQELIDHVARLCDLIHGLVEDFSRKCEAISTVDEAERSILFSETAVAKVHAVLLAHCESWPPAAPGPLRSHVENALYEVLRQRPKPAVVGMGDKANAIASDDSLRRSIEYDSHTNGWELAKIAMGLLAAMALSALYLVIFLALVNLETDLSVHDDMMVAAAAIGAPLGGTGVALAGQGLKNRLSGGGRGRDPGGRG